MRLSPSRVKQLREQARIRLGARNTTNAVAIAQRAGYIVLELDRRGQLE